MTDLIEHVDMWGDCSCDGFSIGHEAGCQRRIVGKEARVKADAKSRARAADEIAALRARVAEMRELLDIAVEDHDSSMGRSNAPLHWTNQARAILSKQEPEYSGWVEVVDEGEIGNDAIAAIGGGRG